MFLLFFFGPVLYKWPLNWRWQIIAMCAHGSTRAQEEKTWLHLVSSSFERWTFSIDLQCAFHSGSRRIQILCNFISIVPSVRHIKVPAMTQLEKVLCKVADCPAVFFRVVYFHRRCFAKFARCHLPRVLSPDLPTKTCLNSTWFLSNFHGQLI